MYDFSNQNYYHIVTHILEKSDDLEFFKNGSSDCRILQDFNALLESALATFAVNLQKMS